MVMTFRGGKELEADIKEQAKALGMSANAYMVMKLSNAVVEPLDFSVLDEVRGGVADGMTSIGENYVVDGMFGRKTRYVIAEGYLWLQKRTLNWSQRYLTKLCKVPECVLSTLDTQYDIAYKYIVRENAVDLFIRACIVTTQCEQCEWYQRRGVRDQWTVFDSILLERMSFDAACSEYNPQPVITEPVLSQPEEPIAVEVEPEVETPAAPPKRVKA